jgi:hypothetical protein
MIGTFRPQTDARSVVEPETSAFWLFLGNLQPLTPPDPFNAFLVYPPASRLQERRNPAIPITAIPAGKLDDVGC